MHKIKSLVNVINVFYDAFNKKLTPFSHPNIKNTCNMNIYYENASHVNHNVIHCFNYSQTIFCFVFLVEFGNIHKKSNENLRKLNT